MEAMLRAHDVLACCTYRSRRLLAPIHPSAQVLAFSTASALIIGAMRSLLIIVVVVAPGASADFLAFGRRLVVLAHLALGCDGFQFLRRVVPLTSDRCAFIEIKFLVGG